MGLVTLIDQPTFRLAVWKIEEEESFFISSILSPIPAIPLPGKRLQFLASRYLFHVLGEDDSRLIKNKQDRPMDREGKWNCSLSHCAMFAALAISSTHPVGVDIEPIRDKVKSIAPRFLLPGEFESASVEQLMIYWSAKESLYKLSGTRGLDLRNQIQIEPFIPDQKGELVGYVFSDQRQRAKVFYQILESHVLTWALPFQQIE